MTIGDKPFEVGCEDHKKSENNASPDDSPAPDKVEKQYLDALQNLVKTIKSKNKKASVAFLLDKVADEKIVEVILPILRTSGVIGVLVVDKANYSQWKLRTLDTEVRYIPRIWNMGGDLLKLMVDKNPEADRAIFYQLVNYLDFMSEGLPKKLAKAVSERCIDLPSSKKGWWPKKPEMQPYLCITEDISTRIAGVGDLHREVTKQIDTIIACINPSPSPETRDAILSSTCATLAWIVDNLDAGKRKFKFKDFVAELQNNGIPTNDKKVVEQVASTIIEALIVQKRIVRRKTDLDASGIFELQES
jgi:hypothetical protein